jgi:TubC N-terminal docking domain
MTAIQTLFKVRRCGVTLVPNGDRLWFHPASALAPELIEELREHKEYILEILARQEEARQDTSPRIGDVSEVLELARKVLSPLKEEDRVDLDELIQANSPPGRDPQVKRETDKAHFFSREGWREAPRRCARRTPLSHDRYIGGQRGGYVDKHQRGDSASAWIWAAVFLVASILDVWVFWRVL